MISFHLKYQLLVTVKEPLQGNMDNGLKIASFFYHWRKQVAPVTLYK